MKLPYHKPEWRNFDPVFGSLIMLLSVLGVFFISAAMHGSWRDTDLLSYLPARQVLFLVLSTALFLALLHLDYMWIARHAPLFYLLGIAGLLAVQVVGERTGGGLRWIPVGPFRLQPSEFMKVGLIFMLARFLQYHDRFHSFSGLIKPFALTLLPMALILVQPDLGTALVCLPVLFVMLVVAGARWRHILLVILLGVMASPVVFSVGLKEYQKARVTAFLNPNNLENMREANYQIEQAKLAIGSGGWFGKGYGRGEVRVPVQTTDFIFTIVGEEGGFFGGLAVIGVNLLLILYLLGIAARTRERFGLLVVAGACALIAFQSVVNLAMTMGFAPITGLTLPLTSYGGSSLMTTFMLLGLVCNIQMRRLRPFGDTGPVTTTARKQPEVSHGRPTWQMTPRAAN